MRRSLMLQTLSFSSSFSARCVYSTLEHYPHPLGYLCAKFRFFRNLHCWANPRRKIAYLINYSVTHPAYLMPREPKRYGTSNVTGCHRGPKRKLRAGYRAPSQHRRAFHSYFVYWTSPVSVTHVIFFIVECGMARFLCVLRVYLKFGHHPHFSSPVLPLC